MYLCRSRAIVRQSLEKDGVKFVESRPKSASYSDGCWKILSSNEDEIVVDAVVIAIGRKPILPTGTEKVFLFCFVLFFIEI